MVKPVDGTASVAVRYCARPDDVRAAAHEVLREHHNARGQVRAGEVIVTEYITGHEVSVAVLTADGVPAVIGVTDKHTGSLPWFVETGHTFPSVLPDNLVRMCARAAEDTRAQRDARRQPAHDLRRRTGA